MKMRKKPNGWPMSEVQWFECDCGHIQQAATDRPTKDVLCVKCLLDTLKIDAKTIQEEM